MTSPKRPAPPQRLVAAITAEYRDGAADFDAYIDSLAGERDVRANDFAATSFIGWQLQQKQAATMLLWASIAIVHRAKAPTPRLQPATGLPPAGRWAQAPGATIAEARVAYDHAVSAMETLVGTVRAMLADGMPDLVALTEVYLRLWTEQFKPGVLLWAAISIVYRAKTPPPRPQLSDPCGAA